MNVRRTITIMFTIAAGTASVYIATLTNPTQPQKDLGRTTNQIFLLGSQSLLKREEDDQEKLSLKSRNIQE